MHLRRDTFLHWRLSLSSKDYCQAVCWKVLYWFFKKVTIGRPIKAIQSATLPKGIAELSVGPSCLFRFGPYIALPSVAGQAVAIWFPLEYPSPGKPGDCIINQSKRLRMNVHIQAERAILTAVQSCCNNKLLHKIVISSSCIITRRSLATVCTFQSTKQRPNHILLMLIFRYMLNLSVDTTE